MKQPDQYYFEAIKVQLESPCIMCVQYIGGCSVHRGMFSRLGEYHEYIGDIMSTSGDIMSTLGDVQYIGGIS